MGLETGSTISSFITSNPTSSDPVSQGDDHIKLIKSVLQAQFPGSTSTGFNTAITATETELNSLHNSGIQNLVASVHADGSGNVGIGTAGPAQKLHVVGNSYVSGTTLLADAGFMFNSDAGQDTGMSWASDGVMNVRCNGATVGQFNNTGFTGNSATATNATNATNATTSSTCTGNSATATYAPLISGTAQAASGATVNFTGIPSWVKRITVMLFGVSTSGSSDIIIRIGATTVPETSGYLGSAAQAATSTGVTGSNATDNGFCIAPSVSNGTIFHGSATITLLSGSSWVSGSTLGRSDSAAGIVGGGSKTITGFLGVVRITTVNGTDTFDAGSINIMYE